MSDRGTEQLIMKERNTIHGLLVGAMIVACIYILGGMSSTAALIVYDIPFGTEFTNAHSYWALGPAIFTALTAFIMAMGMFRDTRNIAYLVSLVWTIIMAVALLGIFVVTMVDIFTCDGPDWWCFDPAIGAVSWRYWWYAASAWLQLVAIVIWIVLFYLIHRSATKIDRTHPGSMPYSYVTGLGGKSVFGYAVPMSSPYEKMQ